ncbi:DUF6148 family protein [Mesorhizobium sp. B2-5-3]|uniref:DUF6148 family protein n=1 Tax=Mesorhizobium sp. B2-5-3 TaxID=2589927 RepID=UPI001127D71F|nr:DUF6148 family protein [Mesorhizobium sp. B2-5-3]TPK38693.1 hypothetical protein FJ867_08795 [Mesorhizobium sp. B2-5-3]
MAGITLATAEAQLQLWLDASMKVAAKQSYSIAGRSLTLADLSDINQQIKFWDDKVKLLSRAATGRGRVRYVVGE